jgi:hypothetical protein
LGWIVEFLGIKCCVGSEIMSFWDESFGILGFWGSNNGSKDLFRELIKSYWIPAKRNVKFKELLLIQKINASYDLEALNRLIGSVHNLRRL